MNIFAKPYKGKKPFIFISYSHKDTRKVIPIIAKMQEAGFRVWYDDGIDPGSEWDEFIAEKMLASSFVISMISKNYLKSKNCRDELKFAREENIDQLLVYIEEVTLPSGIRMRFGSIQAIFEYKYANKSLFLRRLLDTPALAVAKNRKRLIAVPHPQEKQQDNTKDTEKTVSEKHTPTETADAPASSLENEEPPKDNEPSVEACSENTVPEITLTPTEGLAYTLVNDGTAYEVCGIGTAVDTELVIPSEYNGLPVVGISTYAFYNCSYLTSVTIPEGVTSIAEYAFVDCESLESISIPESVTFIGGSSFMNCYSLKDITLPSNVLYISDTLFFGCAYLSSIKLPNNILSIAEFAFMDCKALKSILISNSLNYIDQLAFLNSAVKDIFFNGTTDEWNSCALTWTDTQRLSITVHCENGSISY